MYLLLCVFFYLQSKCARRNDNTYTYDTQMSDTSYFCRPHSQFALMDIINCDHVLLKVEELTECRLANKKLNSLCQIAKHVLIVSLV